VRILLIVLFSAYHVSFVTVKYQRSIQVHFLYAVKALDTVCASGVMSVGQMGHCLLTGLKRLMFA